MTTVVTSYVNPDTDGVACMFGVSSLLGPSWKPTIVGALNVETRAILELIGLRQPDTVESLANVTSAVLVDTHHLAQIPGGLRPEVVVEVIDHHPAGDPEAFLNARIDNQPVGAAATLLIERMLAGEALPTDQVGHLMMAAVLSNTSDFMAPSTTTRDRDAFQAFKKIYGELHGLAEAMHDARLHALDGATADVLAADVKLFKRGGLSLALSQVEAPFAGTLMDRPDFDRAAQAILQTFGAELAVVNLVDTSLGVSRLWASEPDLLELLDGVEDIQGHRAWTDRLLLRKTDLVPRLAIT